MSFKCRNSKEILSWLPHSFLTIQVEQPGELGWKWSKPHNKQWLNWGGLHKTKTMSTNAFLAENGSMGFSWTNISGKTTLPPPSVERQICSKCGRKRKQTEGMVAKGRRPACLTQYDHWSPGEHKIQTRRGSLHQHTRGNCVWGVQRHAHLRQRRLNKYTSGNRGRAPKNSCNFWRNLLHRWIQWEGGRGSGIL